MPQPIDPEIDQMMTDIDPLLEQEYGSDTVDEREMKQWGRSRMVGKPESRPDHSPAWRRTEATGLYKYGQNHLQTKWNFLGYSEEELLDTRNQWVLQRRRLNLGMDTWSDEKCQIVGLAMRKVRRAQCLLRKARGMK